MPCVRLRVRVRVHERVGRGSASGTCVWASESESGRHLARLPTVLHLQHAERHVQTLIELALPEGVLDGERAAQERGVNQEGGVNQECPAEAGKLTKNSLLA